VQPHNIPIVLQVAGDEPEWTTPLAVVETLLKEFSCIKAVQIVEWRCGYYSRFGYPQTENTAVKLSGNRACVLKCGNAIAVMQSRENLFEKQPFAVDVS